MIVRQNVEIDFSRDFSLVRICLVPRGPMSVPDCLPLKPRTCLYLFPTNTRDAKKGENPTGLGLTLRRPAEGKEATYTRVGYIQDFQLKLLGKSNQVIPII